MSYVCKYLGTYFRFLHHNENGDDIKLLTCNVNFLSKYNYRTQIFLDKIFSINKIKKNIWQM